MALSKTPKKALPLSGNRLIDIIFKILIETLEKEIESINVKKVLHDSDNPGKELCGLLIEGRIYLGKSAHHKSREPIVSTLIHELLHEIMAPVNEKRVEQLERVLWPMLTDAQKRYLKQYIPKHVVKKQPE